MCIKLQIPNNNYRELLEFWWNLTGMEIGVAGPHRDGNMSWDSSLRLSRYEFLTLLY